MVINNYPDKIIITSTNTNFLFDIHPDMYYLQLAPIPKCTFSEYLYISKIVGTSVVSVVLKVQKEI